MLGLIDITAINERNIDGRIVYPIRVLLVKRSYDDDKYLSIRTVNALSHHISKIKSVYKNA